MQAVFRAAREHYASQGVSFHELAESGLRLALEKRPEADRFRLKAFGFHRQGQTVTDWSQVRDAIDAGLSRIGCNVKQRPLRRWTPIFCYAVSDNSPVAGGTIRRRF